MSAGCSFQDLTSVQNMQKKHGLLEADVISRQDRIDGITSASENFCQAGHFDADSIKAKQEQVVHRYRSLTVSRHLNIFCTLIELSRLWSTVII